MKKNGLASFAVITALAVAILCAGCVSPTTTSPSPSSTAPATSPTALGAGITVMQGKNFTIQLESNPSTGYSWIPSYDNNSITFISRAYVASSVLPGAPGADVFTFQGTKPGTSVMTFNYTNSSNQTSTSVNYTITCTASNVTQGNAALVSQGQNFTIQLQANPSTGVDWQPSYDNSTFTLVNRAFAGSVSTSAVTIVGASGTDLFTFQGIKPGTSVITFNSVGPENETTTSTTYTVVVTS